MSATRWIAAAAAAVVALSARAAPDAADRAAAIERSAAGRRAWATVLTIRERDGSLQTDAWHYRDQPDDIGFWPASTIKLYTAVAVLEFLHAKGFPLETAAVFSHRDAEGGWITDSARTVPEMLSEVFRRSSNEDYTLLLRLTGIDYINTQLLVPERGFTRSALMRGYVLERPWVYRRDEPQRIVLLAPDGRTETIEHTWSGRSYSAERGATVIDARTGNCASTRDLADCIRRAVFFDSLPENERFRMSPEMARFLRDGGGGLAGLASPPSDGRAHSWPPALEAFPQARVYHKAGAISTFVLQNVVIDDHPQSGRAWVIAIALESGDENLRDAVCRELVAALKAGAAAPGN